MIVNLSMKMARLISIIDTILENLAKAPDPVFYFEGDIEIDYQLQN